MTAWQRVAAVVVVGLLAGIGRAAPAAGDTYEETVKRADRLWAEGKKVEAVRMYGSIWRARPTDVERQILYAERSADVGNYRWSLNFYRVAEQQAKDDPVRLQKVYLGYGRTYRMAGYLDEARVFEEKAAGLASAAKGKKPDKREPTPMPRGQVTPKAAETTPKAVEVTPGQATVTPAPRPTPTPYYFGYYTEKPPEAPPEKKAETGAEAKQ